MRDLSVLSPTLLPRDAVEAYAINFAGRRVSIFSAWAVPMALAGAATVALITALLVGFSAEPLAYILGFSLVLAGLGWLVTAPMRFSRKPLQSVRYPYYAARNLVGYVGGAITFTVIVVGLCLALILFAPNGRSPEVFPFYALFLGFCPGILLHGYRSRSLIINSPENYAAWRARTGTEVPPPPVSFRRMGLYGDEIDPAEVYAKANATPPN